MDEQNQDRTKLDAYFEEYRKILRSQYSEQMIEYTTSQAYETAKLLSVNDLFHQRVAEIREKWDISPAVLSDIGGNRHESEIDLEFAVRGMLNSLANPDGFDFDLHRSICIPLNVNYRQYYNLLTIAIYLDLTPDNLLRHWHIMVSTVSRTVEPGATIYSLDIDEVIRERYINDLTIIYLVNELSKTNYAIDKLPLKMRKKINLTWYNLRKLGRSDLDKIPELFQKIEDGIAFIPKPIYELYVRINEDTALSDIKRTWPHVQRSQFERFGAKGKGQWSRPWGEYERDVELMSLYKELDDYSEVIREYDRRHPDKKLNIDDNYKRISPDVLSLVRKSVSRTRKIVKAKRIR